MEHSYGIEIGTLDNPGWSLSIDLTDTALADKVFDPINQSESEREWLFCEVSDGTFRGSGGPLMLTQLIEIFLSWKER